MISLLTDLANYLGQQTFVLITYLFSIITAILLVALIVQNKEFTIILNKLHKLKKRLIRIEIRLVQQSKNVKDIPVLYSTDKETPTDTKDAQDELTKLLAEYEEEDD